MVFEVSHMKLYPFRKTIYNCKQATGLVLKKEEGKISFPESVKLFYHLLYCFSCRQFAKQSRFISLMIKRKGDDQTKNTPYQLSEEKKRAIQNKLDILDT
jgi:hypothetical protein